MTSDLKGTTPYRELPWALLALTIAAVGTAGSLYLSIGLGLKACPLCFYQRSFVMAVAAVLALGLMTDRQRSDLLCIVSWPLAVAGLSVAGFHVYLELTGKLECPKALLGLGTAPVQSLVLFVLLTLALAPGIRTRLLAAPAGLLLGVALAWGCIASVPPIPPAPGPYDKPPDVCRPPFRGDAPAE